MEDEGEVKGASIGSVLGAMERLRGAEARCATVQAVRGPLREALDAHRIDENAWYPIGWYRELHRAAEESVGEPVAGALGREGTRGLLSTGYRILARLVGPETSWRHASHVFRTFYRPVSLEVLDVRKHRARARLVACRGFDDRIWDDVIGGSVAVIELAGGRDPVVDIERRDAERGELVASIRWR
jgi:hypothetical protein